MRELTRALLQPIIDEKKKQVREAKLNLEERAKWIVAYGKEIVALEAQIADLEADMRT